MPRTALTENEIEAFRGRITDVATHLFAEQGFEAVTLRAVAAELGCSPMTPYRYFPGGKEEIFTAVKAAAFARFADRQGAVAARYSDPIERLRELGRDYIAFALEESDAYRVMFELAPLESELESPALAEEGLRAWSHMHQACCDAVQSGRLSGDPTDIAHMNWAKVHGLVSLHLSGKLRMGRTIEELSEMFLNTMGPDTAGRRGDNDHA